MKILSFFLAVLFGAFAAFQWNDIDPEVYTNPSRSDAVFWLIFYALIGLGFVRLCFGSLPGAYFIVTGLCCLMALAMSVTGVIENITGERPFTMGQQSMSADDPRVELSREFFGGLIALGAIVLQYQNNKRNTGKP